MSTILQVKGSGPFQVVESDDPIDGYTPMSREDYAALVAAYVPPAEVAALPRIQSSDTVLQRLNEAEREALFTARRTVWQVDYFLTRAATTATISDEDPDFPAAVSALDQLGIIAASRWDALLSP